MAFKFVLLASLALTGSVSLAAPQQRDRSFSNLDFDLTLNERAKTTTPVPILRFIDRQNPDGSYTYGFENGDGTYKLETRFATGEVKGKYGYIDPAGELREVEYGATPDRGFEPSGDGVNVPPPTVGVASDYEDDIPEIEETPRSAEPVQRTEAADGNRFSNFAPRDRANIAVSPARRVVVRRRKQPVKKVTLTARPRAAPAVPAVPAVPAFQPAQHVQPVQALPVNEFRFQGHPAKNINLQTGSYTFEYGK